MITSSRRGRLALARPIALAVLLGACGNPRNDAVAELNRLHEAMQRHAARHGRFPQTIDHARPASATNLPHAPRRGVSLSLLRATADGYQARARRKSWICYLRVAPGQPARPDCAPVSPSLRDAPEDTTSQAAGGFEGVLPLPAAPRADSAPADSEGGP